MGLGAEEHELKLAVPAGREAAVAAWLRSLTRPDDLYPDNEVHTLYFDTPGLDSLAEKINGDCEKTKVRLRWYAAPGQDGSTSPVFLETKERLGAARAKRRIETDLDPAEIAARPFDPRLGAAVTARLRDGFARAGAGLQPTLLLRYRRQRFFDPASQARISLDSRIRTLAVNPRLFHASAVGEVPMSVVEVKSTAFELPRSLRSLLALGCRPRAISKYALCAAGPHRPASTSSAA